jgi:hypothetical protein
MTANVNCVADCDIYIQPFVEFRKSEAMIAKMIEEWET